MSLGNKQHKFGGSFDDTIFEPLRHPVSWQCKKYGFQVRMCKLRTCPYYQSCKNKNIKR